MFTASNIQVIKFLKFSYVTNYDEILTNVTSALSYDTFFLISDANNHFDRSTLKFLQHYKILQTYFHGFVL